MATKTEKARPARWKSRRAKICLMLGAFVLALAALEVGFRCAGVQTEFETPRVDRLEPGPLTPPARAPHAFFPNCTVISKYASDPRSYFGNSLSVAHHFNSAGWRDREHALAKPSGTFRILGLGDSCLYGQGVKREDICLSRLEGLLKDELPGMTIEAVNTGMSGFNTADERDLLTVRGLAYDPDFVILHFVLNDVEPNVFAPGTKVEFYSEYVNIYQQPDWLSRYSKVWAWARQRYLRNVRARNYIEECVNSFSAESNKWKQCRAALDDIQQICRQHHIPLLVVIFPFFIELNSDDYPFQSIHDVVREHCESQGIAVLDLRETYRDFSGPELWVHPTDQHPNEQAHEIAAAAMLQYLREHPALLKHVAEDDSGGEGP